MWPKRDFVTLIRTIPGEEEGVEEERNVLRVVDVDDFSAMTESALEHEGERCLLIRPATKDSDKIFLFFFFFVDFIGGNIFERGITLQLLEEWI